MVEEIKQLIRNGLSPEMATNQVVTEFISSSPEYKAAQAKLAKAGKSS